MEFVETPIFTRRVQGMLSDDAYRELQGHLAHYPDSGTVIVGSGGLRKLRWASKGHGKRGGVRVIYYWIVSKDRIIMVYMYPKSKQDDLPFAQLAALKRTVEEELKNG